MVMNWGAYVVPSEDKTHNSRMILRDHDILVLSNAWRPQLPSHAECKRQNTQLLVWIGDDVFIKGHFWPNWLSKLSIFEATYLFKLIFAYNFFWDILVHGHLGSALLLAISAAVFILVSWSIKPTKITLSLVITKYKLIWIYLVVANILCRQRYTNKSVTNKIWLG